MILNYVFIIYNNINNILFIILLFIYSIIYIIREQVAEATETCSIVWVFRVVRTASIPRMLARMLRTRHSSYV